MVASNKYQRAAESAARGMDKAFSANRDFKVTEYVSIEQFIEQANNFEVLVGIPQENTKRKNKAGNEQITNAELAFIHTNGVRSNAMRKEMQKTIDDKNNDGSYSKAYQMYIQAHGTPAYKIPPRPIIEPAIEAHKSYFADKFKIALLQLSDGDIDGVMSTLNKMGMAGQNFARAWFTDGRNGWAPNAAYTVAKKGSGRPLIDTGELRKSITYIVKNGSKVMNKPVRAKKTTKKK